MYTYTFGGKSGKKSSLRESNDKIVVRTRDAMSLDDAVSSDEGKEALEDFVVEMEVSEADVTVLKTKDRSPSDITLRDHARSVLKKEPELRFAGRVLIDPDSQAPVLYTENIFIKFHDEIPVETCEKILADSNLVIKQKLDFSQKAWFVSAPENIGLQVFEISETLLKNPAVELCHPELIRKKGRKTIHPKQWHLKATTIGGEAINAHVKVDLAHNLNQGENIIIAVIDDGIDIDHPEFNLPGKVVSPRDATNKSNNPRPKYADEKHGTACAGVATASGIKASGVAPKAVLMPIRSASELGSINEANAFKWARDHGADVISCSWGAADGVWEDPGDPDHTLMVDLPDSTRLAIEDAVAHGRNGKGCVITFAAGNGNEDVMYDGYANNPKVMAVAACNDTGKRSVYSDYGSNIWCSFPSDDVGYQPYNHPVPLTNGVYTTDRTGSKGYNKNSDYCDTFGGTSSSCPGVAGTAALILSANPDLTWLQVREIIKETAEKIDAANGDYDANGHSIYYGYGRVDAEKAVKRAIELKNTSSANSVKIKSALVDPIGTDTGKETITLKNTAAGTVDLSGWSLEVKNKKQALYGILAAGESKIFTLDGTTTKLANTGGTINLLDPQLKIVDSVAYQKKQVKAGVLIEF